MLRPAPWVLASVVLAGCGPKAPPPPPPEAALARAAAEEWRREEPVEGVDAVTAGIVLARAEKLLADGTPDAAAFEEAAAGYREAIVKARAARAARREALYQEALDARSRARALRTRLSERQLAIETAAAASGSEGAFRAAVRDFATQEVFKGEALLATDASLEKADVLFADGRLAEARDIFAKAEAQLEALLAKVGEAEVAARARSTLDDAEKAVAGMRQALGGATPPPAALAEAALDAARRAADGRDHARAAEQAKEAKDLAAKALRHDDAVETAKRDRAEAAQALDAWTRSGAPENDESRAGRDRLREGDAKLAEDPAAASEAFRAAASALAAAVGAGREALKVQLAELREKKTPPPMPPDPLDTRRTAEGVRLALDWLARHQDDDGRWSCADYIRHDPPGMPRADTGAAPHDVGTTGLALLCFLGAGYTGRGEGPAGYYNVNIEQALRWLRSVQDGDGVFGARATRSFMYGHAIATVAMAEATRRTGDPALKKSAELAVRYIESARNSGSAWRYEPGSGANDTSVTVWCVEALAAAEVAGIAVDPAAPRGALSWVDSVTDDSGRVGYDERGSRPNRPERMTQRFPPERSESMTAAGILIRVLAGEAPRKEDVIARGTKLILDRPPTWVPEEGTIDMYYWRAATRALRLSGCRDWPGWRGKIQAVCLRWQVPSTGAHNAGSWDPVDPWGEEGGRLYSTAMMTLALIESGRAAE